MKLKALALLGILSLSACAEAFVAPATGFTTGNDVSFLRQGDNACPGTTVGTVPGYPLRCGPQSQTLGQ